MLRTRHASTLYGAPHAPTHKAARPVTHKAYTVTLLIATIEYSRSSRHAPCFIVRLCEARHVTSEGRPRHVLAPGTRVRGRRVGQVLRTTTLQSLRLGRNRLGPELPTELGRLRGLRLLDVSGNGIAAVPPCLATALVVTGPAPPAARDGRRAAGSRPPARGCHSAALAPLPEMGPPPQAFTQQPSAPPPAHPHPAPPHTPPPNFHPSAPVQKQILPRRACKPPCVWRHALAPSLAPSLSPSLPSF